MGQNCIFSLTSPPPHHFPESLGPSLYFPSLSVKTRPIQIAISFFLLFNFFAGQTGHRDASSGFLAAASSRSASEQALDTKGPPAQRLGGHSTHKKAAASVCIRHTRHKRLKNGPDKAPVAKPHARLPKGTRG